MEETYTIALLEGRIDELESDIPLQKKGIEELEEDLKRRKARLKYSKQALRDHERALDLLKAGEE